MLVAAPESARLGVIWPKRSAAMPRRFVLLPLS